MRTNVWEKRGRSNLRFACFLVLVAVAPKLGFAQAAYTRVDLSGDVPRWVSSAAYVPDIDRLGVIDPLRNALILIDAKGKSAVLDSQRFGIPEEQMVPALLNRTEDGFVLSMVNQQQIRLNLRLERSDEPVDQTKAGASSSGKIISTYDSVVAGSQFLSFGAVKPKDDRTRFGFFRSSTRNPNNFQVLMDLPQVQFYTLGHRLLAGTETGQQYAVIMAGTTARVVEFLSNGKLRALDVIPAAYRAVPTLQTQPTGLDAERALFAEIERLTIPTGLYAQDGYLYLLTRQPKAGGGTLWRLFQIDPKDARVRGSIDLPTSEAAHHLSVVNTAKNWYFVERGEVDQRGAQAISSMVVIPNAQIRALCLTKGCQTAE